MKNNIDIGLIWNDNLPNDIIFDTRPRISFKVVEYIFNQFCEGIFIPHKILKLDKGYSFVLCFSSGIANYISVFDRTTKKYSVLENIDKKNHISTRIGVREGVKTLTIDFSYSNINDQIKPQDYMEIVIKGFQELLNNHFPKVKYAEVQNVINNIDYNYLMSLPYPAPFKEQNYILDKDPNIEIAYIRKYHI